MTQQQASSLPPSRHPIERVLGAGLKRLLMWGIPLSVLALVFGAPTEASALLPYVLGHLAILQIATYEFTVKVERELARPWFTGVRYSWLASAASLIAAAVGFSALLTLATSAAAGYQPSLQFLQLLSSMDIAWVVGATYIGSKWLFGRTAGLALGSVILIACIVSIGLYLDAVGFTADGGWLVDSAALLTYVIPADVMAALIALGLIISASVKAQRTLQASPQS